MISMRNTRRIGKWILLGVALTFIFLMAYITLGMMSKVNKKYHNYENNLRKQVEEPKAPKNLQPVK